MPSDTTRSILMGAGLAFVGSFFGPVGAQIGWFLGSSLGSLMALEDQNETTHGPRVTDFKILNSKYGIAIPRGYGCFRLSCNMVWAGDVIEETEEETNCVELDIPSWLLKLNQLFGGSGAPVNVCITEVTYHYYQSAAFALCEGPIEEITRIWADGKLVYSVLPENFGVVELAETLSSNDETVFHEFPAFTLYFGTADQGIDPVIAADLGEDAVPFRNIAYFVINDLLLDPYGYRIPTLNVEVCYKSANLSLAAEQLESTSVSVGGYATIGLVDGRPDLLLAISDADNTTRVVYDLLTRSPLLDSEGGFSGGLPTFFTTTNNYLTVRGEGTAGGYRIGVYNFQSGAQVYWYEWTDSGDVTATGSGVQYVTYHSSQAAFSVTFTGGALAIVPNRTFPSGGFTEGFTSTPVLNSGEVQLYTPSVTGVGREVFFVAGERWWLTDGGAGAVYIHRLAASGTLTSKKLQFTDASDVDSANHWTYYSTADAFYISVDVAGTSPAGLYRLDRSTLLENTSTVALQSSGTPGYYNSTVSADSAAFQTGSAGAQLFFQNSSGTITQLNLFELSVTQVITTLPAAGSSLFSPSLQTIISGGTDLIAFRAQGAPDTLDEVVKDLMTTNDADPRLTLTEDDIDVTDLALDSVRGFPLLSQQSVRNAITILQQTYFFDVVESDGKIKFIKRGQAVSAALVENELAAHEFGKSASNLIPITLERQAETELPREVVINYTDFLTDYQQGTQRSRRHQTDAESNVSKTLPIVLSADEAAKIADVLLASTWNERVAPVEINVGPQYLSLEPSDVISVTMNNGTVHVLRIVDATLGANFVLQLTCQREFASLYVSTAEGIDSGTPPSPTIPSGSNVEVFLIDLPANILTSLPTVNGSTPTILVGAGTTGDPNTFAPVTVTLSNGAKVNVTQAATFGTLVNPIGTPTDSSLGLNQFDYTTEIVFTHLGGVIPDSCTQEEALTLATQCLVIVGGEIIAFTNVSVNGNTVTLNGGLLRGLYGTDRVPFHAAFETVLFLVGLVSGTSGTSLGVLTGSAPGGTTTVIPYAANSIRPLTPANPSSLFDGTNWTLSWNRRDYSPEARGFRSGTAAVPNSSPPESYAVRVLDVLGTGAAQPKRTLLSNTPIVTYTEAQQIADWGAARTAPFLVEIAQVSSTVGLGWPLRVVVADDDQLTPAGEDFSVPEGVDTVLRWNGSGSVSGGALTVSTTVDETYGAVYLSQTGATQDVELLALITPQVGALTLPHAGVVLRGLGGAVTGTFIGLGGASNDTFSARQMLGGNQGISQSAAFAWTPSTAYRIRARHLGSRVQAKVWADGEFEPAAWQLDFLDGGQGPYFGFSGVFAYHTSHSPVVDYLAWAYRGLSAA